MGKEQKHKYSGTVGGLIKFLRHTKIARLLLPSCARLSEPLTHSQRGAKNTNIETVLMSPAQKYLLEAWERSRNTGTVGLSVVLLNSFGIQNSPSPPAVVRDYVRHADTTLI